MERLLPGARVVKAFNTVFADVMTKDRLPRGGQRATAFIASNDGRAADAVAALAQSAGFAPIKVGPLSASRYLEAMAHPNTGIAVGQKGETNAAFVHHQIA
jgi:8-hydroxy-5-deazaflavin:NADPH oxidoreductase